MAQRRVAVVTAAAFLVFGYGGAGALAATGSPARHSIAQASADGAGVRHAVRWPQLQALAGQRLRDAAASRLLSPALRRLLGTRYEQFKVSLGDEQPLRVEGGALVGEGVVPDTLGYRGAFMVFGSQGELLAVLKSGRHGTTIERFGSLELLNDAALLHAYQEFVGIDE
jgi:hypothetical protein